LAPLNYGFIIPFIISMVIGLFFLSQINTGDESIYFNVNRTSFWDTFFIYGTQLGEEPVYAILTILALVFINFRTAILIPTLGFSIMGLSFSLKKYFAHPRPYLYFKKQGWLDQIELFEGMQILKGYSSFPSGHTMSGFGLFFFLALQFKQKTLGIIAFIFAFVIGFSRIYLFHHFLKDVLVGAFIGVILAYLFQAIFSFIEKDKSFWLNKNLLTIIRNRKS
ncbi:MAG: phosphatase PAP2 family protein, partial [Saprospiraceae bacterium]